MNWHNPFRGPVNPNKAAVMHVAVFKILLPAMIVMFSTNSTVCAQGNGNGNGGGGNEGPVYEIHQLETIGLQGMRRRGVAWDINSARLVVGATAIDSTSGDEIYRAAAWSVNEVDGQVVSQMNYLDNTGFDADSYSSAHGCNASGEIVGSAGDIHAVYWSSAYDMIEDLPAPLEISEAAAINNQAIVCGMCAASDGNGNLTEVRALVWSRVNGQWQPLQMDPLGDPGTDSTGQTLPDFYYANDLSEVDSATGSMTVVGYSNHSAVAWTVYVDGDGQLTKGPTTILDTNGEARAVNNQGMIAGQAYVGVSSGNDGIVWIDGGPAEILALDDSRPRGVPRQSWPSDVNDNGLLVGGNFWQAIFWQHKDAPVTILDDFLRKGRNATFTSLGTAYAVNAADEIVGRGWTESTGLSTPFLAIPVSGE